MCGIVVVLARPSSAAVPDSAGLVATVEGVAERLEALDGAEMVRTGGACLTSAANELGAVDQALRGPSGLRSLLRGAAALESPVERVRAAVAVLDAGLDALAGDLDLGIAEQVAARVVALKDAVWSIACDRLGAARRVLALLGDRSEEAVANLDGWWALNVALASLDRLEVRGRDSAGVHVLVSGHGLDRDEVEAEAVRRDGRAGALFTSGSVRWAEGSVGFVYKAAAEIGELGDNVKALSAAIASDALLARAVEHPDARVTVVAHTRWASVGLISQANAHPVNSEEPGRRAGPYVVAALNGDVDNHADLRQLEGIVTPPELTTDAKVIPTLVSHRMVEGQTAGEAFADAVARFDGSVAIAASIASTPDEVQLALRGSGQSLYVGLAEDAYVVASEPYGLVEETQRYVRMDGERSGGEIMVLSRRGAGTLDGITRRRYASTAPAPVSDDEVIVAEITTRDIDRRGFDHFLLKEISEAPASFRKTLRGRIVADDRGGLAVRLGEDTIPAALAEALGAGRVRRVAVIGQGTAAVAGQAVAAAIARCLPDLVVQAVPATELSGFGLDDDMSDTLIVAISQSGTTTDTNRTVDLARTRGAFVVAVVNRRNSDLAAKSHGVMYTSDGRDVEMSVASTKAFYAQVAAGWILAAGLADAAGGAPPSADLDRILADLRDLPEAMEKVLARRDDIGRIAAQTAPARRYWAVVGSGPDRVAASEIRIKLSELCYRSISADSTEDKKHIDLSCEPMVIVCAAGLQGANADDVAKEVAIYQAHKAAPVVVVSEGEEGRFKASARDVITVPRVDPAVAFVLSAMVGHLFGYEAALSIDAQARVLRGVRAVVEKVAGTHPDRLLERVGSELREAAEPFYVGLRSGSYNGNLEASTAVRLVSLLRYAGGSLPLDLYESETGKIGTPEALLTDLIEALNGAIDELTRPVDAIKHQAKTVTVGISRSEDALFGIPLVAATLGAGAAPDTLGYRALRTLGALDPAVDEVLGYTRYRIDWAEPVPTAHVIDQGGIAVGMPSRTDRDPRLLGSKHRAAEEREVSVVKGASDGRTVVLVPEVKARQVTGMTLLHVRFHDRLDPAVAAAVLGGYRTRLNALRDAVTETEATFDTSVLGEEPIADLLTEPVYALARRWRTPGGSR